MSIGQLRALSASRPPHARSCPMDMTDYCLDEHWLTMFALILGLLFQSAVISKISSTPVEMSLLLGQGGEFAFVVVGLATGFALIPEATAQFMLIVFGATMFLTPVVAELAQLAGSALRSSYCSSQRQHKRRLWSWS